MSKKNKKNKKSKKANSKKSTQKGLQENCESGKCECNSYNLDSKDLGTESSDNSELKTINCTQSICEEDYTCEGEHPEDRIFADKKFINELANVQTLYFDRLALDLKLNELGNDLLFDYIYNSGHDICFEEYLENMGKTYKECTEQGCQGKMCSEKED
jgi:hypothetical protein